MERNGGLIPRLFRKEVGRPLRRSVGLSRHSSFRIGGKADLFFAARNPQELESSLRYIHEQALPFYVIGEGTNILFDDDGFRGLIVKNEAKGVAGASEEGLIEVLAGTPLSELVEFSLEEGYTGLEFAAGIPGTVGGAVFGNAGAWGCSVGQRLKEAVLLDGRGERVIVQNDYFEFGYRYSSLKKKHLTILKAIFQLRKGDKGLIKARIEENLGKRKSPYPSARMAYAGSFFKNPVLGDGTKTAAGLLLEKVGAKELRMGGAAVYSGHANFILNTGRAKAADVLLLAQEMKARVKREFGIELEEEVIFVPAASSML